METNFLGRRALLRSLVLRYQQASPTQKALLLDAFVEWTGYTRKHAIKLLNHGAYDQQTIQRHRQPQYGQEVQQARKRAWKAAAHYVCAKRLMPSWSRYWTGTGNSWKTNAAGCAP